MELPKTIDLCPIVDALLEIRFTTSVPASAVFGVLYGAFQPEFSQLESLPLLQIPEAVRSSDPMLRFKPHHKMSNGEFVVQLGPDVLTISSFPKYVGWAQFSKKIFELLDRINNCGILTSVSRIGIRYINFFEDDIFKNIQLDVCLKENPIAYRKTVLRTEIEDGIYINTLQVANNATVNGKNGSLIDIDVWNTQNLNDFFAIKESLINDAHFAEKKLFFSLLKDEYLKKYNPKY